MFPICLDAEKNEWLKNLEVCINFFLNIISAKNLYLKVIITHNCSKKWYWHCTSYSVLKKGATITWVGFNGGGILGLMWNQKQDCLYLDFLVVLKCFCLFITPVVKFASCCRPGYSIVRVWPLGLGFWSCAHHQIFVDRSWILLSKIKNFETCYLFLKNW